MLSRRRLLQAAGAGALGLVLPGVGGRPLSAGAAFGVREPDDASFLFCFLTRESALSATPFEAVLRVPPTLAPYRSTATTDYYGMTMRATVEEIIRGVSTPVLTYQRSFPGPTIRARRGRAVVVRQRNALGEDTVVHLHGAKVAPEDDGHPLDVIAPGGERSYHYPNDQQAATLWYHDHALMKTGPHVYKGLAGFYIIGDEVDDALGLPQGEYDVPIMLQDRIFDADGSMWYPSGHSDGVLGDVLLVNGRPQPRMPVATRLYRLRLLNASNCRIYQLAMSDGRPLTQIATDAGLLSAPVTRSAIDLAPAERVEVIADFTADPVGTQVVLKNLYGDETTTDVLRFDVLRVESEPGVVPPILQPITPLGASSFTRTFDLSFDHNKGWVINGQGFDGSRVDANPTLGSTEIWRFRNLTGLAHPMHLHLVSFLVLDRNGLPPEPGELGWKDTVLVHPSETVRVIAEFTGYTGRYVFHCHNLEHEDHDMMNQFEVVPPV